MEGLGRREAVRVLDQGILKDGVMEPAEDGVKAVAEVVGAEEIGR